DRVEMEMVEERWPHVCRLSVRRTKRPQSKARRESDRTHPHQLFPPHSTLPRMTARDSRPVRRAARIATRAHALNLSRHAQVTLPRYWRRHADEREISPQQSGPAPPWHRSRKGDKRPGPPGSGLAAVRQAKM